MACHEPDIRSATSAVLRCKKDAYRWDWRSFGVGRAGLVGGGVMTCVRKDEEDS